MSNFGTIGFMTLEPATSKEENISFTGITQNGDGTATLTGVTRGLGFVAPYTNVPANQKAHAGGTVAIVSNSAPFYDRMVSKNNDETVSGVWSFTASPTVPTPVGGTDVANKDYVNSVVAGIATTVNLIVSGVAGETLVAGNLVYLKVADGRWWKSDADTASTVENVNLGIAQGAGAAAGAITGGVLTQGLDSNQSALTASTKYYASNVAGAISTTAGTKEVTIGFSHPTDATKLYFQPRFDQALTEDGQDFVDAAVGGTDFYGASVVGTDAYAITVSPTIGAYATGMKFRFKADVANTGACTLAVSGLSALAIKKLNDQDLATGDIEAGQIVEVVYDGVDFQMQSQTAQVIATNVKFGGTGADGALALTSGATNIDLAGAAVVTKNYTSISITGTGSLTFTNPHANGTIIILKSQGDVTLTSSTAPMIDGRNLGSAATTNGNGVILKINPGLNGGVGVVNVGGVAGVAGTGNGAGSTITELIAKTKILRLAVGAGGGVGGNGSGGVPGGAGGRGGGGIYIESAGAWNFTTASGISVAGTNGSAGQVSGSISVVSGGGGGGGGAGGFFVALYASLTANTGTITISGGAGGAGGDSVTGTGTGGGSAGGAGGNGSAGSANGGTGGNGLSNVSGGAGGGGGGGAFDIGTTDGSSGGGTLGGGGGGGGASGYSLVIANTEFN